MRERLKILHPIQLIQSEKQAKNLPIERIRSPFNRLSHVFRTTNATLANSAFTVGIGQARASQPSRIQRSLLQLQQQYGNRYVQRVLSSSQLGLASVRAVPSKSSQKTKRRTKSSADVIAKIKQQYDPYIKEASAKYGMAIAQIRAIMATESKGEPTASSGAAWGLMQITKSTWKATQKNHAELKAYDFDSYWKDPKVNILFGAAVLKNSMGAIGVQSKASNFAQLAVVAYNAGPGTVKKAIALAKAKGSANPEAECLHPEYLKPAIKQTKIYTYYLTNEKGWKRNPYLAAKGTPKDSSTLEQATEAAIDLKYQEISQYPKVVSNYMKVQELEKPVADSSVKAETEAAGEPEAKHSQETKIWFDFADIVQALTRLSNRFITAESTGKQVPKVVDNKALSTPLASAKSQTQTQAKTELQDTLKKAQAIEDELKKNHPNYGVGYWGPVIEVDPTDERLKPGRYEILSRRKGKDKKEKLICRIWIGGFLGYKDKNKVKDQYVCTTFVQEVLRQAGYQVEGKIGAQINIATIDINAIRQDVTAEVKKELGLENKQLTKTEKEEVAKKVTQLVTAQLSKDSRVKGVVEALVQSHQGAEIGFSELEKKVRKGDLIQFWRRDFSGGHVVIVQDVMPPKKAGDLSIVAIGSHGLPPSATNLGAWKLIKDDPEGKRLEKEKSERAPEEIKIEKGSAETKDLEYQLWQPVPFTEKASAGVGLRTYQFKQEGKLLPIYQQVYCVRPKGSPFYSEIASK